MYSCQKGARYLFAFFLREYFLMIKLLRPCCQHINSLHCSQFVSYLDCSQTPPLFFREVVEVGR